MVAGTTVTDDSSGFDQLGRLGKDVKADAAVRLIGERSTAAAGKGERPTTRGGPESTELGPRTVSSAHPVPARALGPRLTSAGTSLALGANVC